MPEPAPTVTNPAEPVARPRRPSMTDIVLTVVAIAAVSSSAPIVRVAEAPAFALAGWRMVFSSLLLVPAVAARRVDRPWTMSGPDRRRSALAGLVLAAHFATWIPSLALTAVASSVTLVTTTPIWTVFLLRWRGEQIRRGVWIGIGLALSGVVLMSGVDLQVSARALAGDALALAGGMFAAGYVVLGGEVRRHATTTAYTAICYPVAAIGLLVACLVSGQRLSGWPLATWGWLVALAVGPQLLGHSVFNRLVKTLGPTVVSMSILGEIVGAAILAAVFLDETPPLAIIPAAVLIASGIVLAARTT